MTHPHSRLLAIVISALALATVPPLTFAEDGDSTEEHVERSPTQAPPPPRAERRPHRPFRDAVWTNGFWEWNGRSYVWQDGSWVRPEPGRRWSPYRWEQRRGRWFLVPGGWVPTHEGTI
ncbi:MAG: hypothetical protein U0234_31955 [Sandaracinus sp.]